MMPSQLHRMIAANRHNPHWLHWNMSAQHRSAEQELEWQDLVS